MTSPSEPDPDLEVSPGVDKTLEDVAAQIGPPDKPTVKEQVPEVRSQDGPLSGDVVVDWGGTKRSVKIEDLVTAARRADDVTTQAGAIDTKLAEMGQLQQLRTVLDGLDPTQLRQLQTLVANPAQLTAMANGHVRQAQPPEDDLDTEVDRLVSGTPPPAAGNAEIAQLKAQISELQTYANSTMARDQKTTLEDHVAERMGSFPVFKEIEGSQGMTKRSIMNAIATAGQNANVDTIVASHAADLHKLIQGSRQGVTETRAGAPSTLTRTAPPPEGWVPKAEDLFNKKILRAAEQKLAELDQLS